MMGISTLTTFVIGLSIHNQINNINIIVIISDGMSMGTLNMTDLYLHRKTGKCSNWIELYKDNRVKRGLMDMTSASSIVTDSAAAKTSGAPLPRTQSARRLTCLVF